MDKLQLLSFAVRFLNGMADNLSFLPQWDSQQAKLSYLSKGKSADEPLNSLIFSKDDYLL